jgi:hypothetical protein
MHAVDRVCASHSAPRIPLWQVKLTPRRERRASSRPSYGGREIRKRTSAVEGFKAPDAEIPHMNRFTFPSDAASI